MTHKFSIYIIIKHNASYTFCPCRLAFKNIHLFHIVTLEDRNAILTLDIFMEGQEQIWKKVMFFSLLRII